jgi:hypothetical protein
MESKLMHAGQIQNQIFTIRGKQVMLDSDLARIYGVPLKRLNEQVKRNLSRFPKEFRFQLTKDEYNSLRSQFATLKESSFIPNDKGGRGKHRKHLPYVFTEQGVSMLSAVLHSEYAIKVSVHIMNAFVEMRRFLISNESLFQKIDRIENKQLEYDEKFDMLFKALDKNKLNPEYGIFFDGQIFDAYTFVSNLIRSAEKSILLIDNYIDDTVLEMLGKRKPNIEVIIFTKKITSQLKLDLQKYNSQYPKISIKEFTRAHDRFMIIDDKTIYHIGASLKDLGKKWFAFSRLEFDVVDFLSRME